MMNFLLITQKKCNCCHGSLTSKAKVWMHATNCVSGHLHSLYEPQFAMTIGANNKAIQCNAFQVAMLSVLSVFKLWNKICQIWHHWHYWKHYDHYCHYAHVWSKNAKFEFKSLTSQQTCMEGTPWLPLERNISTVLLLIGNFKPEMVSIVCN